MTTDDRTIDHYVWKGFYIHGHYDDAAGTVLGAEKEDAMELITDSAAVPNEGWEENSSADYPLYQIHDTAYHIITVVREPVYSTDN